MGWRRNLAQRAFAALDGARARALEIRAGTPAAGRFAAFGAGSVIQAPYTRLVGEHAVRIGGRVTILTHSCIEAYAPYGEVVLEVGDGCYFSHGVRLVALNGIRIGAQTALGQHVTLTDTVHDYKRAEGVTWRAPLKVGRPLVVGSGVWVGVGAVVVGGITIGDGAIVAPNSVITQDVPARTLVGGAPARALKRRGDDGEWRPVEGAEPLPERPGASA